jgi:hypothetical protein
MRPQLLPGSSCANARASCSAAYFLGAPPLLLPPFVPTIIIIIVAQVISVGPGAVGKDGKTLPMHVAVGDRVLLPEYGGHVVKVGDDELHLYRDEDILAKLQ